MTTVSSHKVIESVNGAKLFKGTRMKPLCTLLAGLFGLIVSFSAWAEPELSDAKKMERVYQMYAGYREDFPAVKEISVTDAMGMIKDGQEVIFVDTRRTEEMEISMLPGAISKKMFLGDEKAVDRDSVIIGYCTIGYRSGIFARDVAENSTEIYNLKGGLLAWVLEGGTVYDRDSPARRIHVYGDTWRFVPNGYEAIVFPFWKQFFPFQ